MKRADAIQILQSLLDFPGTVLRQADCRCGNITLTPDERDAITIVMTPPASEVLATVVAALREAHEHLNYTGYGDRWEREVAGDLDKRISAALDLADAAGVPEPETGPPTSYHAEAFEESGRRIGGFEVQAATMSGALYKAAKSPEVAIRPTQFEMRVKILRRVPNGTPTKGELVGAGR